ncbi:Uncharacterised protein [Salmonella enterica subsp. enterica serovar Bovismorbificans]|uniref:Uncharacterized protein n=1 Tax=Salmonella enterica subsp. enterica serovar Bovismorbificans TaxID=58097 RepID=A0A655EFT9_SALET|nr:Uncharacterised protein [Salmonella enterica subsp. enterica serovar Bovismorbificans]CNU65289.1 Uncharacterised protein [Salmonella enterica subsp. enterica serovar Bovismorbificans]CNU96100.1 Uncharacterised protein [Salmonella enterica subsp. enterica serovar Bovismorbificans]CNV17364.1 Uncharacterised protein [Salmonella enterica subsp. enterica serovar Bovismorbificans]
MGNFYTAEFYIVGSIKTRIARQDTDQRVIFVPASGPRDVFKCLIGIQLALNRRGVHRLNNG